MSTEAIDSPVDIPRKEINEMAEAFRRASQATVPDKPAAIAEPPKPPPDKPAAPAPAPAAPAEPAKPVKPADPVKAPEVPVEPALPADVKGNARQAFEKLEGLKNQYKKDFETLKPQYETVAAEKARLEAERAKMAEELEAAKKIAQEVERISQLHEEKDKFIKQYYIENDPQFQAHYGQRIQAAKLEAVEAVGPEHAEKVKAALEMPPALRKQHLAPIVEVIDEMSKLQLMNAVTQLQSTEKERTSELAKSRENHAKLQEVRAKEAQEQAAKAAEQAIAMRTSFLQKIHAQIDPELNGYADADGIRTALKKVVFNEATSDEYIGILADAGRWRKNQQSIKEKDELIAKLQAQVAETQAANPTVQSSSAAKTSKPGEFEDIGQKWKRLTSGGVK